MWLAIAATGEYDEQEALVSNPVGQYAAEYRYDSGRARYLVRPRHPNTLDLVCGTTAPGCGAQWHDHAGDEIWSDFGVNHLTGAVTERVAYNAGVGFEDGAQPPPAVGPMYFHGDQIGTTRVVTDSGAQPPSAAARAVFTAFGEPVCGAATDCGTGVPPVSSRYRYAGAWGYEAGEDRLIDNGSFDLLPWEDPVQSLGWLHIGRLQVADDLRLSAAGRDVQDVGPADARSA